ncbi:MAG: DUF4352 domain-containing protein [Acidobacteriota bacterium]|nr:DUF4352 domain-containing protein [Acidobacteriota bacterium]
MRRGIAVISFLSLGFTGCSSLAPKSTPTIYAAGDKASAGSLLYNLTDAESVQQLGDDPSRPRTPKDRFYLIKVSVSNSGSEDQPIPAMTLVDDSGQTYPELADGSGVPNWLGVVRKVGAAQTEQGNVVFDAPMKHYRLRLNDALDEKEIAIDVPVSFVRVSSGGVTGGGVTSGLAGSPLDQPAPLPKK